MSKPHRDKISKNKMHLNIKKYILKYIGKYLF